MGDMSSSDGISKEKVNNSISASFESRSSVDEVQDLEKIIILNLF